MSLSVQVARDPSKTLLQWRIKQKDEVLIIIIIITPWL
jgi:hypothetical protein